MENNQLLKIYKEFYDEVVIKNIENNKMHLLSQCNSKMIWPKRGVMFILDLNESSFIYPNSPRIVYVGTHADNCNRNSKIWNRIKKHIGNNNGYGNHRISVLRSHIGKALINRYKLNFPTWGVGNNAPVYVLEKEKELEKLVSDYIKKLAIIVIEVNDEPSKDSMRVYIKRNSIALLSKTYKYFNNYSTEWLGLFSQNEEIRKSYLWNIDFTMEKHDENIVEVISKYNIK